MSDKSLLNVEEFNRAQSLGNFPPDQRWEKVEGVLFQPRSRPEHAPLVSIGGRDHTGAEVAFWTDLPNAMYMLNLLAQIQKEQRAAVPSRPPSACLPYDGNA